MSILKKKRPPNAYLLYSEDVRENLKKENPDMKMPEINKFIAKQWKNETKEVLDKYKELAAIKQAEFKKENPDYRYKMDKKPQPAVGSHDPCEIMNEVYQSNMFALQALTIQANHNHNNDKKGND